MPFFLLFCLVSFADAETLTFPQSIQTIEEGSFFGDRSIEEVVLPEGILEIGSKAFAECSSLWRVVIPESVEYIAPDAFDGSTQVSIWADVESYASDYAVMRNIRYINSNGTLIGSAGENVKFILKDGELTLSGTGRMTHYSKASYYPWYYVRSLIHSVRIEEGVTSVGPRAFQGSQVNEVIIPESVTYIGSGAFAGFGDLQVYGYAGSYAEDWCEDEELSFHACARIVSSPEMIQYFNGETIDAEIAATGDGLTYLWEIKPGWVDRWYVNFNGTKLQPDPLANHCPIYLEDDMDGSQLRCTVTDAAGNTVVSEPILLSMKKNAAITKNPSDVRAAEGTEAVFTVEAEGDGLTYQWQRIKKENLGDSTLWRNIVGAYSSILSFTVEEESNEYFYHVLVTDQYGSTARSAAAEIKLELAMSGPEDIAIKAGETATFSVQCSGEPPAYQWQVCFYREDV